MIVCFECDRETKSLIDSLAKSMDTNNLGEVISLAIKNLSTIKMAMKSNGIIVIDDSNVSPTEEVRSEFGLGSAPSIHDLRSSKPAGIGNKIPDIFARPSQTRKPTLRPMPDDRWISGQDVPVNRWLFAMYNRLLPVKANCRALIHYSDPDLGGIDLAEALRDIPNRAAELGLYFARCDKQLGLSRDLSLATAFPSSSSDRDTEKSKNRYGNQFIASVDKIGRLSGFLHALKLINYERNKKLINLYLTDAGWTFAQLWNPVLDSESPDPSRRFSEEEIEFLLAHISRNVPVEYSAILTILKLVQRGATSPEAIDEHLLQSLSTNIRDGLSKTFLESQRSGAISRMSDLDLISRVRSGVTVAYELSERGKNYLEATTVTQQ